MTAKFLTDEDTHSSPDSFEKQPFLIIFENVFNEKIEPVCSPNGPMLEFEINGDRYSFVDLQKIYLEIGNRVMQANEDDLRYDKNDPIVSDSAFLVNNSLDSLYSE